MGAFATSLSSVQELQGLLRAGGVLPGFTLAGTLPVPASLQTFNTINEIQTQLGGTAAAFDIVVLQNPPGQYATGLEGVFAGRNSLSGQVNYDGLASGALLQGGVDTLNGGEDFDAYYFFDYRLRFDTSLADAVSGGVGRSRIAEGGAVIPRNRAIFRFQNVNDARYLNGGKDVARFTTGFERTFFDDLVSLEMRLPFAGNSPTQTNIANGVAASDSRARLGNLTAYLKALLWSNDAFALSGGIGVALPTASDIRVGLGETALLRVANQSVHFQPFIGFLCTPSPSTFVQGFFQTDFAANGNDVHVNTGSGLALAGVMTDPNFAYIDLSIGHWLYESKGASGRNWGHPKRLVDLRKST